MSFLTKSRTLSCFLFLTTLVFSQKKVVKKIESKANTIEISTVGLDDFIIENTTSKFIEIELSAENPNTQHIIFSEESSAASIQFKFENLKQEKTVFRKFITKRLQRASVVIKIPKNKRVIIFGDNINIASKSYNGNLDIYIEKGILKLNTIKKNTNVKLYAGSIYATTKDVNIDIASNIGEIKVNQKIMQEQFYNKNFGSFINFTVKSIKANIFLTTQ